MGVIIFSNWGSAFIIPFASTAHLSAAAADATAAQTHLTPLFGL